MTTLTRWTHPKFYMGETFEEYYTLIGQTRDSSDLDKSNFDTALKLLGGEGDGVLVNRSGHWACGWVEGILIHESAADKITIAEGIKAQLASYPVLDESDYYNRQNDTALATWQCLSYDERKALCVKHHCNTRAARTVKSLPRDDDGGLWDYLTTD